MKKIISVLLAAAILAGNISALAAEVNNTLLNDISKINWVEEELGTSDMCTPIPINEVCVQGSEQEETQDIPEYEPIVHEEIINEDIVFPEESVNLMPVELPEPGQVSLFSVSSPDSSVWNVLYNEQFGDDYLTPYKKSQDGQKVSGNTNRLIIEETDLTLPGKNGLDVVIKRQHDNQDYNDIYSYYINYDSEGHREDVSFSHKRYIYRFTNQTTYENIYVGFLYEDQLYQYMYNGCYLKALNEDKQVTCNTNGVEKYYKFENLTIADDSEGDRYLYDESFNMVTDTIKYEKGSEYSLTSRKIFNKDNYLGYNWKLIMPESYLYSYEHERTGSGNNEGYRRFYVGAFRDINGTIHTLKGNDTFTENGDTKYKSTFTPDDNDFLKFESMYTPQTLYENGPKYNFVVYDNTGITYYFYNTGVRIGQKQLSKHAMYIVAVKDNYGNMIRYEYGDTSYGKVKKIIDTYGREINITDISNGTQISYYDDLEGKTKNITYTKQTLGADQLDNDSPLRAKEVNRFIVTNENGESTIYDSRESESAIYFSTQTAILSKAVPGAQAVEITSTDNIERIIYPTGSETRYRYKCLYIPNGSTKVCRGVYVVEDSYDLVNQDKQNHKEYQASLSQKQMTITCEEPDIDRKTVTRYNSDGLLKKIKTTPIETATPYKEITYTYKNDKPKTISTDENGTKSTIEYTYSSHYPNLITEESDGNRCILYTYHRNNQGLTDKIKNIEYQKPYLSTFRTEYSIETQLTDDKEAIEYEWVVQNNIIKAQKKYEYDDEGNITAIKQWTNDTNDDGTLDENDTVITLSNSYTTTAQKTKNTSNTVADILNADGVNDGAVNFNYEYNIYGLPTSQTDSYGTKTTIEYDNSGRPVKYNLPNGGTRSIEYHTANKYTLVTDEAGIVTDYIYDGLGRIKAKYKLIGSGYKKLEQYEYDDVGRLLSKISYRNENEGTRETYTYDILNRLVKKTVFEYPNTSLYTETYEYTNSAAQAVVTKTTSTTDNAVAAEQKSYYDKFGQLTKTESIAGDTTLTTLYENDYLGRVTKVIDPNGNSTSYEYAYDGQVTKATNADGKSVSTVYDLAGQAVSVTDAKGYTTNTEYDKLGRTIKVTTPFNDTANGETKTYYDKNSNVIKTAVKRSQSDYSIQEYKYDNMGNMTAEITKNNSSDMVTQYKYDRANRITKMITGLTEYSANPTGGTVTQYSYNTAGFLSKLTDPMGYTEAYTSYDIQGNLLSKTDKNGNTVKYLYGVYGLKKEYSVDTPETRENVYNNLGQITLSKSVNADGETVSESYEYDAFGRVIKTTSNDGTVQNYSYDSSSNLTQYELVKDDEIKNSAEYEYDNINRLTKLTNNDIMTTYSYDANGNLTKKLTDGGIVANYAYNKAGLITSMSNKKGSSVYNSYNCTYLLNGLKSKDTFNGSDYREYTYDRAGQLILEMQLDHNTATDEYSCPVLNRYEYDAKGNRTRKFQNDDKVNREDTTYTYDANNRLISSDTVYGNNNVPLRSERYYYDKNGNQTARQKTAYTSTGEETGSMTMSGRSVDTGVSLYRYDAFNRMTSYNDGASEATYTYNANNLRAGKTVNRVKTDFTWNGQNLAGESTNGITNTYTYDVTGIHSSVINGIYAAYIKDTHGNVSGKINADGALLTEYKYDSFGNLYTDDTPDPFGYCGEYLDNESGLIYLRNRYYDTADGRFITEDPIKDGLNWYAYCGGNPVLLVDPSGLIGIMPDGSIYMSETDTEIDKQLLQYKIDYSQAKTDEERESIANKAKSLRYMNLGKFHVDSDKSLDYYKIYDVTDKLMNYMRSAAKKYGYLRNEHIKSKISKFKTLVQNKGEMDLKNQADWQHEHFIFNGEVIDKDAPGNINYGYFGASLDLFSGILYAGAGYAQIAAGTTSKEFWYTYFDDPRDHHRIQQGIKLYQNDNIMHQPQPGPAPER